jgi:hypothetical protein
LIQKPSDAAASGGFLYGIDAFDPQKSHPEDGFFVDGEISSLFRQQTPAPR